jgi:glutamyl-tRNA synthetase
MSVRVRFAPSPSGFLHVGGARTALYNRLWARARGGTFVLRIEDTDVSRSTDASVDAILDALRWLGVTWDEGPGVGGPYAPYFQSQRGELYRAHADRLFDAGHAYPCTCAAADRDAAAEPVEGRGCTGGCRALDPAARAARRASGEPYALRFAVPEGGETGWDDVVRGRVTFRHETLEDFVLVRSDGLPTYNFACVVDDHHMAITHVIRGDDHVSNTPRQLLIYAALGATPPVFAHASMILGPDGKRLSKRHGATSVEAFGEQGIVPEGMVNFLALLGWALDGEQELFTLAELERVFSIERLVPNPAIFNVEKLEWVNAQHLKRMDDAERVRRVEAFLAARGTDLSGRSPEWRAAFVRALGDRLRTLADAESYGGFALHEELAIAPDAWADLAAREGAGQRLRSLADRLDADREFSLASLERAMRALAAEQGVKFGELVAVARVALTGRKVAPGIFDVIALLGRERAGERLRAAARRWDAESPHAAAAR